MKKLAIVCLLCVSAVADDNPPVMAPDNFPPPTCLPCGSPPLPWGWWFWPYWYIQWWITIYGNVIG